MDKFCKDCKHCIANETLCDENKIRYAKCGSPRGNFNLDLLTGKSEKEYSYCFTHRKSSFNSWLMCRLTRTCGKDGRFWEPKEDNK